MASRKEGRSTALSDFRVGSWLALPTLNLIRDGGTERHLEPQVMDLLAFLVTTGGRVVSKVEIIDAVWEGRFIAEATLTRSMADLRRALGDNQRCPQFIETIPKRGYRLVAPVSTAGQRPVGPAPKEAGGAGASDSGTERGPVVLPFARPARSRASGGLPCRRTPRRPAVLGTAEPVRRP